MRWSAKGAAALGVAAAIWAHAYVRSGRDSHTPYFVDDPSHVRFFVNSQTQAGLKNAVGNTVITADSSPTAAILEALDRWNSISDSNLHFDSPASVITASGVTDGRNVITFADTRSNRDISAGAVAVTRLISDLTGKLTDTDIVFNPQFEFSTTLQAHTFDIEGTLVHELGHAVGLGHAGSASSTMFATIAQGSADLRTLSADDTSYPRGVYPPPGLTNHGSLAVHTYIFNGPPAAGVLVAAIEPEQNILLTGLSDAVGRAEFRGVPPGNYLLYAEPANEPALPGHFSQLGVLDSIRTTILGGPDLPLSVSVAPGAETATTLRAPLGSDSFNIVGAGGAQEGAFIESDYGLIARPGGRYFFEAYGDGLDAPSLSLSSVSFLGTGVSVAGPFERDQLVLTNGRIYPLLRFRIEVAETAPAGSLSLMVRLGDQLSLFTGAVEVAIPTPTPTFPPSGVVHAASFEAGPLSPGGIFSIFGTELAPAMAFGYFDPLSGGLIEILRGVSVLVDDRPAPLFYVSPEQINAQAPADLQQGSFVSVRVLRNDVSSESRILPVASAVPGVFVHPQTSRAIALNQDGSLNSPTNPADAETVMTVYLTGAGAVAPTIGTGLAAPLPPPLSHVVEGVMATIGGQPAIVEFAGAAPGFVGLTQVNIRLPALAPAGEAVALRILAAGSASQPGITISIR